MNPLYFNEFDPFASAWLGKLFPNAHVDTRSICDVQANDLTGYTRAHFFGGIGGWELALRLAGWPAWWPVWTGSCPCQPYSAAGKQEGDKDPRNLWPDFRRLILQQRPPVVFGEQVSSAIGHGWLDGVCTDMEKEGYAVGAIVLGAHSVSAPHRRQRLWWVAYSRGAEFGRWAKHHHRSQQSFHAADGCRVSGMADTAGVRSPEQLNGQGRGSTPSPGDPAERPGFSGLGDADRRGLARDLQSDSDTEHNSTNGHSLGSDTDRSSEAHCGLEYPASHGRIERGAESGGRGLVGGCGSDPWARYDIIPCLDEKARRIESGTFPLADGVPNRVGRLRGYGNAIVPQVAATFIAAFMDTLNDIF